MRPRRKSQVHNPHRPRLSARSMRARRARSSWARARLLRSAEAWSMPTTTISATVEASRMHGHQRGAPPSRQVQVDRRGEGNPPGRRRQRSYRCKSFGHAVADDPNRAFQIAHRFQGGRRIGGYSLAETIDHDCFRETLVRVGGEDAVKNFRRRRLRGFSQRGVKPRGKKCCPHVDLARRVPKGEVPFEPQVLKGHCDRGDDCECDGSPGRRGKPRPLGLRPKQDRRPGKDGVPASRSDTTVKASLRVCRARTRHRRSRISPSLTFGKTHPRPNHYDKNPCVNLCPAP